MRLQANIIDRLVCSASVLFALLNSEAENLCSPAKLTLILLLTSECTNELAPKLPEIQFPLSTSISFAPPASQRNMADNDDVSQLKHSAV